MDETIKKEVRKALEEGLSFYEEGYIHQAIESWERALNFHPGHPQAVNFLNLARKELASREQPETVILDRDEVVEKAPFLDREKRSREDYASDLYDGERDYSGAENRLEALEQILVRKSRRTGAEKERTQRAEEAKPRQTTKRAERASKSRVETAEETSPSDLPGSLINKLTSKTGITFYLLGLLVFFALWFLIQKNMYASLYYNGIADLESGHFESAKEKLLQSLKLAPDNRESLFALGMIHLKSGQPVRAQEIFEKLTDSVPQDANAWYHLGEALYYQDRKEASLQYYEKALEHDADNFFFRWGYGITLRDTGRFDEAAQALEMAIEAAPNFSGIHYYLGETYLNKGLRDRAAEHFETAVALDPFYEQCYRGLGDICASEGNFHEALTFYDIYLNWHTADPEVHVKIGDAYASLENYEAAMEYYDRALLLNPFYANAFYAKSALEYSRKNYLKAQENIDKAMTINPNERRYDLVKARVSLQLDKREETLKHFERYVNKNSDDAAAWKEYGLYLAYIGYEKAAENALVNSLKYNPDQPEVTSKLRRLQSR